MDYTRRTLIRIALSVAAAISLALLAAPLRAQPINYGNHPGTDVTFNQVVEDSATDSTPLFGAPLVSGNGMSFTPTAAFNAKSITGIPAVDITDGKLSFTLDANNSNLGAIHTVAVTERGDYTLQGSGTAVTHVTVGAPVDLTVTGIDGVAVTPIPLLPQNLVFTPSAGAYNLVSNSGTGVAWFGSISINVDALLAAAGGPSGRITEVQYVMDNTLFAQSESSSVAIIEKKNATDGVGITVNTPEPSTAVLALLGSLALVWHVRRRRAG